MAKRMGFQFRQPRAKMPKLDITITSSQRVVAGPSNIHQQKVIPETPAQSEDAWFEDEDDEFFVLASQVAENLEANAAAVISQSMNISMDTSYSRFREDARPVHSTQLLPIAEFDQDEDIFSNLPDFLPNAKAGPSTENKENNVHVPQQFVGRASSDLAAREAREKIQSEAYAEKIKKHKKTIETLNEQLSKAKEKCTTKEGEASTLRYEVDSKTREIDKLRRARIEEADEIEKKYAERIAALEKKIETQRAELEFKNLEILNKKSRRSLNDSVIMEAEGSTSSFEAYNLFKLHTNPISSTEFVNIPAAEFLAAKGLERHRGLSERDFDTLNCLNALQSIYNGAKTQKLRILDENMMKEFKNIMNVFIEMLRIHASRLTLRTPTKYNPATECKILSDELFKNMAANNSRADSSDDAELFPPAVEKLIYERQMLAVVALLCSDFSNTTQSLLFEKCEDSFPNLNDDEKIDGDNRTGSFVDILTDVLCAIGHSKTLSLHKGLIESASLLIVSLAKSYAPNDLGDLLLLNLFQAIVFCEPDLKSLGHLSEFLELISVNDSSNICHRFCTNETSNVIPYPRYKINRISIDTCPLQIYSCLLQISFQSYGSQRTMADFANEVVFVTNITMRMIKFLRNCFDRRVDWLFRKGRNGDESLSLQVSYCYCYVVSCIIVLLHFCINSWMENHRIMKFIDIKLLKNVFSMGSLFLYDVIKKHYEPKVLGLGGFPVKNRLQAIHDWISSFEFPICLSFVPKKAIQSVNLRRIPQLNEPQMVTIELSQQQQPVQMDSILSDSFDNFSLQL